MLIRFRSDYGFHARASIGTWTRLTPAVQARLAACAQVTGPIASTFWWEEDIERAEEWMILLKLPADRYDELAAFLIERHSYDEPEIVATAIVAGSPGYLSWIQEETRPE